MRALKFLIIGIFCSSPVQAQSSGGGFGNARFGQTITLSGVRLTPIEVLEDSRCPRGVECIWAGQIRIRVRIGTDNSATRVDLGLGGPMPVSGGTIALIGVQPQRYANRRLSNKDYRFTFRFEKTK